MTDDLKHEPQSDPAESYELFTGWNTPAVCFALLAFYCVCGFIAHAVLGHYAAAAWAAVSAGLALALVNLKRWK